MPRCAARVLLECLSLVHSLDVTFGAGALFGILALVLVAAFVRLPRTDHAIEGSERVFEGAELIDGEGFEWLEPELVA